MPSPGGRWLAGGQTEEGPAPGRHRGPMCDAPLSMRGARQGELPWRGKRRCPGVRPRRAICQTPALGGPMPSPGGRCPSAHTGADEGAMISRFFVYGASTSARRVCGPASVRPLRNGLTASSPAVGAAHRAARKPSPCKGADSPYQGEMSRRDKGDRDRCPRRGRMRVTPCYAQPPSGGPRASPAQNWECSGCFVGEGLAHSAFGDFYSSVGRGLPDAPLRTRTGGRKGRPYRMARTCGRPGNPGRPSVPPLQNSKDVSEYAVPLSRT